MKFVKGMGWVSSDGRVLPIAGQKQPDAEGIAHIYQENASLRELVLLFANGFSDDAGRQKVIDALVEHEILYGNLTAQISRPAGIINATK